jgi:squalene-hopene/tetraprenyl-beta-curcumene cyclase
MSSEAGALVLVPLLATLAASAPLAAGETLSLANVTPPPPLSADEPLAAAFSLERAAAYLDRAALHWQKEHGCGTCHTNFAYLMARPALAAVSRPSHEVRAFFEDMVERAWEDKGPRWPAEVVVAAATLAMNDAQVSGELHPTTRKALDRMWTLQRDDGGWTWLECGWPPMESDPHYGATLAALGVGLAPGGYAQTDAAQQGLDGIRRFLRANPPPSLHHRAMLLWASRHVDGLIDESAERRMVEDLLALQRPDGGWATASLFEGWKEHRRKDGEAQDTTTSDGYGTAFVLFVLRQAGVPHDDARLRRAADWLKRHQRASGRWFTRSPTRDSKHYLSNAGTAFAVMALKACGEVAE